MTSLARTPILLGKLAHADGLGDPDPPLDRLGGRDLRFLHPDDAAFLSPLQRAASSSSISRSLTLLSFLSIPS